jgi:hypothetical protein
VKQAVVDASGTVGTTSTSLLLLRLTYPAFGGDQGVAKSAVLAIYFCRTRASDFQLPIPA